jgi:ubiquinone/menaquinone biosynthesis C-methylase UbiE
MNKSQTDIHWNERAINEPNSELVNIADVSQRELETQFLLKHLTADDRILEVGCGNGFLTNILRKQVEFVDAFDYSENMIMQARVKYGETNNRFFHSNVLQPFGPNLYDCVVCVRVLINLRNFEEQKTALKNMHAALKPGGRLLLIEGYIDGFEELNRLRISAGISPLSPAAINYYSRIGEMKELLKDNFELQDEFHTGCFDFLTRVIYPTLVGPENASGHSEFHRKILPVAKCYNPDQFKHLARLNGFKLVVRH